MGIQGLLPFLKKIHQPVNVSQFAGCTVAIDAYCWLHKGAFSCAEKLALGEKTDQYVYYCMKYINYLLSKNIKPIMVFDGCHLPSKKNVEKTRREKREINRKKAAQFLREGKRAEARECLQRCIDISPEMALQLMNTCRNNSVDCIVAPYEADAQLAYLNKIGVAQVIITEDSDLLLFGCERVLFKMDHAGNGVLIEQRRLNEVMEIQPDHYTFDKFRYICILSGCDYLPSLPGIGLAKATKVFKIARQAVVEQLLTKLSTYLKCNITVPPEYIEGFKAADNTFLYQLVFDPLKRKLVPLNSYGPDVDPKEMAYAGSYMPQEKALQIALGNINIYNGEKFADFDPERFVPKYGKKKPEMLHMLSMWSRGYRVKPRAALKETQTPERPNMRGREVEVRRPLRRSPRKRAHQDEDCELSKTNSELTNMYGDGPPEKKVRPDVGDDLHRFMFAKKSDSQGTQPPDQSDSEPEPEPANPGGKRTPAFFNSLREAHPTLISSPSKDEEEKENHVKSPTRNMFACRSPSKRLRFNLNAEKPKPVEVKSRFFSPVSRGASKDAEISKQTSISGFRPAHSNTENVYNETGTEICDNPETDTKDSVPSVDSPRTMSPSTKDRKSSSGLFKFTKTSQSDVSSPASNSAFNWSKFKFNKQGSSDSLDSTKSVHNPFKKVVSSSKSNSTSILNSSATADTGGMINSDIDSKTDCDNDNETCDKDAGFTDKDLEVSEQDTSLSEKEPELGDTSPSELGDARCSISDSYPYSIDSMYMSQQTAGSQDSLPSLPSLSQDGDNTVIDNSNKSVKRVPSLSIYFKPAPSDSQGSTVISKGISDRGDTQDEPQTDSGDGPAKVVFIIESDDEDVGAEADSLTKPKKEDLKPKPGLKLGGVKPGCRVSGLSRKSRKSSSDSLDKNQPKLKDMFAKFSYNKQ
ncbi:exonuclease 1-like [Mya arenaria]|uniref:exonuclease 1-like n=1 Tax=Mya arenaria TaxID=6604 RepID=UPI0022E6D50C|nr:exonuclease 1-like [Mya arenaria]